MDLPFVTLGDGATPPKRISSNDYRAGHEGSFERHWTVQYRAWHLLGEFADGEAWRDRERRLPDGTVRPAGPNGLSLKPWREAVVEGHPPGTSVVDAVNAELDDLVLAAETERADALGEIIAQGDEFVSDFMGLIDAKAANHRATHAVVVAATLIAGFAAQNFKQVGQRPRPSQVCPALKPPLSVPGHASYPSGHATQSFLIATCLAAVFETKKADGSDRARKASVAVVRALAERIARNREIAGLHYRSDTEAGRELAAKVFAALNTGGFAALLASAADEWD